MLQTGDKSNLFGKRWHTQLLKIILLQKKNPCCFKSHNSFLIFELKPLKRKLAHGTYTWEMNYQFFLPRSVDKGHAFLLRNISH